MSAYSFRSDGGFTSLGFSGGNMTPTMPAGFQAGDLLLLTTGVNSTTIGVPSISGWTQLTTNGTCKCDALFGRIALGGDTAPTFQWDSSHQAYARILAFSGDVPATLTGIVNKEAERATNSGGAILVNAMAAPTAANCLVIRAGHCIKTATNNGSAFKDWSTDSGIYTQANNAQLVQSGTAMAAALWYWQQTNATATDSDSAFLTNADSSNNTQAYTIALNTAAAVPPGMQCL